MKNIMAHFRVELQGRIDLHVIEIRLNVYR